jgi:predicted CopG family antitoxin
MTIQIKDSTYRDILMGKTGNAFADLIPSILQEKKREGYEIVVVDDLTVAVIERL